ncbi:hypothetical protein [Kitasatospora sp. NPDC050543]|uniref:hypothetical protein n=1 Tax=Kitasatospora sp. NPDC050543 TaxID=3364054 RepID=UPI0037AAF1E6
MSFHDEHGLTVGPFAFAFAFAVAAAAVLRQNPALGAPVPGAGAAVTAEAIATSVTTGNFVHLVDRHGRRWSDPPGANPGVSLYPGAPGARTEDAHPGDAALHPWPPDAVLSGRAGFRPGRSHASGGPPAGASRPRRTDGLLTSRHQ